ncbi:MAG TPA: carbohydrate ABC transporter permease [Candidatus Mediterraneibacter merdipullorum]|nr:carbohydrate ABC transporter permease [Candidatus Mediterraneibacter merdipullorum]
MRKHRSKTFFIYLILGILVVIFLFPLFWAIVTALRAPAELSDVPMSILPKEVHLENFSEAWNAQPFTRYLINSLIVTSLAVIGMVLSSSIVAYGFARFEFRGKKVLFMVMLSTMMIPWDVLVIPLYMQYNAFGWLDSFKPLIIPAWFGGAFYIYLMVQFLRGIPRDFEESAVIDGANHWQIFTKIFVPLMKPQMFLSGIMYMIVVWNDYLGPLVYISDSDKFTLPIGLSLFKGAYTVDYTSIMAIAVLMTIPTIIAFFLGQKQILNNDAGSGIKG